MHIAVPKPGSILWIRQQRWRVDHARVDRGVVRLDVSDRRQRLTFLVPFDRPVAARRRRVTVRVRRQHALARLAGIAAQLASARGLRAAATASVEILPHQFEPALAVLDGARRVLVADEVGLGKTIQAGLILAELKTRDPSLRALVIVPRSLCEQWIDELNERFHLDAELADRDALQTAGREMAFGANPWTRTGVRVVSADYLKQPQVFDALPLIPWDVVIIDEAHDVCGPSARYEACAEMSRRARHVVLLTATPHQGDPVRFGRLERLGLLEELADELTTFRRTRATIAAGTLRRVRWLKWRFSAAESAALETLVAFERSVLAATDDARRDGALLLLSVFRKRALSTMAALRVSVERRLAWVTGPEGWSFEQLDWFQPRLALDDAPSDDEWTGVTAEVGLDADVERRWLRRLRALTTAAAAEEHKIRRLARLVSRTSEPVVVFTEFRDSLEAVARRLGHARVAVLHGGLSSSERRAAMARFERGDVAILLATDVASQGLNLQARARWVVSLDLPWVPTRIEQRIGRVDRLGQKRSVHLSMIVTDHPMESNILRRLAARAVGVRRATGQPIDALVPPTERQIAQALLTNTELVQTPPSAIPLAHNSGWQRRARAAARQAIAKRQLGCLWRAPVGGRATRAFTSGRSGECLSAGCGLKPDAAAWWVFRVAVGDGFGRIVDECLLAAGADSAELPDDAPRLAAVMGALQKRCWARAKRLTRLAARRADRSASVEAAITRHLARVALPGEMQLGLFDKRRLRAFAAAEAHAFDLSRLLEERAAAAKMAAELRLQTPTLEAVFLRR